MKKRCFVMSMLALLFATTARASDYDLFHSTPSDQLGPMRTDRPTKSMSPWTVEPGHVQLETGVVDYAFASQGGVDAHQSFAWRPPNSASGWSTGWSSRRSCSRSSGSASAMAAPRTAPASAT